MADSAGSGTLSPDIAAVVGAFGERVQSVLGNSLFGIYLYGSLTFTDSRDLSQDIDFHVVVHEPLGDERRQAIHRIRPDLARELGPLAGELDGYVVLDSDLQSTSPPRHQLWPLSRVPSDGAWALHCAHIRSGRVITLFGSDPTDIYPTPSWPDLRTALFGEIRFVDEHLVEAPAYAVLNATRILYSFHSRDVVISKAGAAGWALEVLERQLADTVRAALRHYLGQDTPGDQRTLESQVRPFVDSMWRRIANLPSAR
ncbi:MAG TPA: aminoglycoside adenylyltransferase domain-containing protein [Chloroflexota bacterium]|nr:aminoglycoside adenylyltransferase domain-containing protein [Chloroflexota bacterium]